jgi:hypothetical protein
MPKTIPDPFMGEVAKAIVRTLHEAGYDKASTLVACMRATSLALCQLHPGTMQRLVAFAEGSKLIISELETL